MKNINFSYTKSKQSVEDTKSLTLKDVSLIFKKGSITALVGSSGSGKSTIAQLIMNYYRPEAGKVLINA
jgi:ABC-type multidrug transport system fused ATPase/permease subunit